MVAKRSKQSPLVRVHDVAQEYWYIDKSPCSCGGRFQTRMQMVSEVEGTPVDVITVACKNWGEKREYQFDISTFHGAPVTQRQSAIAELIERVDDEDLKHRLMSATEDPVVNAMHTILDLAESGDRPALDWLLDAILDPEGMAPSCRR